MIKKKTPSAKNKKESHCQCKKNNNYAKIEKNWYCLCKYLKRFAFPVPKKNKKSHWQFKKQKEFSLPMQKSKIICIAHANNTKKLPCPSQIKNNLHCLCKE